MNYPTYETKFRKKAIDAGYSEDNIQKCLEYAKNLLDKGYPVIYNSSNLSALVGYKRSYIKRAVFFTDYFYRQFTIAKKNGKPRQIKEPLPSLKEIQLWILTNILYKSEVSKFAKAYLPEKSILDNVKYHKDQKKVICIDLDNFFPSIKEHHVLQMFINFGYSKRVSEVLSKLCCNNGSLPQGAPTSPQLSNIYLYNFDTTISKYCIDKKIRYTRYADDMTFSGQVNEDELFELLERELNSIDLKINERKTKIMTPNMRQVVTGVIVNKKLQVPLEKRKELRQAIYYIEKFGLTNHLAKINCSRGFYLKHLLGLVNYVLFINPDDNEAKLQKEFLISLIKSKPKTTVYKKDKTE